MELRKSLKIQTIVYAFICIAYFGILVWDGVLYTRTGWSTRYVFHMVVFGLLVVALAAKIILNCRAMRRLKS